MGQSLPKKRHFPFVDVVFAYDTDSFSGGIWPASPNILRVTRPLGRMLIHVMLPWCRLILSQASGGNCIALNRITDRKKAVLLRVFGRQKQLYMWAKSFLR